MTRPLGFALGNAPVANDRIARYVAEIQEMECKLAEEKIAMERRLWRVDAWIDQLPPQQARVMRLRYVDGMKMRDVAKSANYSTSHCNRIISSAMKKLDTK